MRSRLRPRPAGAVADVSRNPTTDTKADATGPDSREPFYGIHQGGIQTKQQANTVFAAFDITTTDVKTLVAMLQSWTTAAARLTAGQTASTSPDQVGRPPSDSGEVLGLPPRRLTLTFGFGPGLFEAKGQDRFGLRSRRPAPLADLPNFNGDQLQDKFSGGDLCVQACADDQFVAFHAIRQLASLAGAPSGYGDKPGAAALRWIQTGFIPDSPEGSTPRNLLGFKDGDAEPRQSLSRGAGGRPHHRQRQLRRGGVGR